MAHLNVSFYVLMWYREYYQSEVSRQKEFEWDTKESTYLGIR